jgi:hypothetical protein
MPRRRGAFRSGCITQRQARPAIVRWRGGTLCHYPPEEVVMNRLPTLPLLLATLTCGAVSGAVAQERPYSEGSVWDITYVQTEPGQFDAYLHDLRSNWRRTMEAAKAEGHVLSYRVISSGRGNPQDWNLLLLVEYPNMAALDNSMAIMERISREVLQRTPQQQSEAAVQRGQLREILGGKLGRELIFTP